MNTHIHTQTHLWMDSHAHSHTLSQKLQSLSIKLSRMCPYTFPFSLPLSLSHSVKKSQNLALRFLLSLYFSQSQTNLNQHSRETESRQVQNWPSWLRQHLCLFVDVWPNASKAVQKTNWCWCWGFKLSFKKYTHTFLQKEFQGCFMSAHLFPYSTHRWRG